MQIGSSAAATCGAARVGFGVHGHALDAQLAAGADDAHGDLAAVRDRAARLNHARLHDGFPLLEERPQTFLAFGRDAPARRWPAR